MTRALPSSDALRQRLADVGRTIVSREAEHADDLSAAREQAEALHRLVAEALEGYHEAVEEASAGHLRVELGPVRPDDKHVRAVEFDLSRGRTRAIVTVKSRGQVTLVGPFKAGRSEGPCKSFPFEAGKELDDALAEFLEGFLHEAATP